MPVNVHVLNGNPGGKAKDKLVDHVSPQTKLPRAPDHLLPDAAVEWRRIGRELKKLGLVSSIDRAALALYCQAWARWVMAETKLKELGEDGMIDVTPSGFAQMSTWLQISNRAATQLQRALIEFGMSPAARNGVTPLPKKEKEDGGKASDKKSAGRFFS